MLREQVLSEWKNCKQKVALCKERLTYYQNRQLTKQTKRWKGIVSDFNSDLLLNWEKRGFTNEQVSAWMKAGLALDEYLLTTWLRDAKQISPSTFNFLHKDELEAEFKESFALLLVPQNNPT